MISLETAANGSDFATALNKQRLVIGHNVSFDRSYVKEQYFIKVSIGYCH